MSKTKRFDIHSEEPNGTTFCKAPASFAGATNTKRKASFGVGSGTPNGTTFLKNSSHISMPNADSAPSASKSQSSKTGHYSPPKSDIKSGSSFSGRPGIGKSSPK